MVGYVGSGCWRLCAPLALALSHPAVFVAGGIGLAIGPAVWKSHDRGVWVAYIGFLGATAGSFTGLYLLFTRAQESATLAGMSAQWATGFPPLRDPLALVAWLVRVHTGSMFAYPCGGERGASVLTSIAVVVGAFVLWKRDRTLLAACLAPFALALVAAALRRYPYGGVTHGSPARIMQFLAPAICLLAGLAVPTVLRPRLMRLGSLTLVLIGIGPLVAELTHPYRSIQAERARNFARTFWPELAAGGEPVCLRWDLSLGAWDSTDLNVAVYLCNQKIYSPIRKQGIDPRREGRVQCVESLSWPDDPDIKAWLESMTKRYTLQEQRTIDVGPERYVVYDFVPVDSLSSHRNPTSPILSTPGPAGHTR